MLQQKSTRAAHFHELLEVAPDAIILFEPTGRIVMANSMAEDLFGYQQDELVGQSSAMLMPLRFRERHETHQVRFFANPCRRPMGSGMELFGLHKSGEEFPIEISLGHLESSEGLLAISTIRDISEHRQLTEKLEQTNQELQNALALVKQLTGILPICSYCKKIRDERGQWDQIESYICEHSEAQFTHSVCPECARKHYGPAVRP